MIERSNLLKLLPDKVVTPLIRLVLATRQVA